MNGMGGATIPLKTKRSIQECCNYTRRK